MKSIFSHIYNKCKQYTNRIFYTDINTFTTLHYMTLISSVLSLDDEINKHTVEEPHIVLVSNNVLFKSIVFIYCFFTGTKLTMISPKFSISEIINVILSRTGLNILLLDNDILNQIKEIEELDFINILQFFIYVDTTNSLLEKLIDNKKYIEDNLRKVYLKGQKIYRTDPLRSVSILSPGTSSESCIINVPYKTFGKSTRIISYFMNFKPSDKVSIIADFEYHPNLYTILGLTTGIHYIQLDNDIELSSILKKQDHKPNMILISSNNFKKVWDNILLDVYSNKFIMLLSNIFFTSWITNKMILFKLHKVFGPSVKKVHILNEELGYYVLDILKKSKIMFTSSYGFLEQGNFLAFKDPELFGHKDFIYKSGGTILKMPTISFNVFIDNNLGEIVTEEEISNGLIVSFKSDDIGSTIKNVSNQGDRKYLHVYGRKIRNPIDSDINLDILEKSLKDTMLIRDCFIRKNQSTINDYDIFIELREDLLDITKTNWDKTQNTVYNIVKSIANKSGINIKQYGILKFNGMRNIAGKLQYYNIV